MRDVWEPAEVETQVRLAKPWKQKVSINLFLKNQYENKQSIQTLEDRIYLIFFKK